MFDEVLIESAGTDRQKGTWITALISAFIHVLIIGAIIAAGLYVKENPEVIEKPITAFIAAAPPPPPPPPAAGGGAPRQRVPVETPQEPRREEFAQPRETPRNVPVFESDDDETAAEDGVVGGVRGGQRGGVVGGEIDGQIDGQIGGSIGGRIGGQIGGTGDAPVHVGGNVKAPIAVKRVDPVYTEIARKARLQGIVIVEAVIDRQGNVTEARVLKPLGMGLDMAALNAIRQWKFTPGTLNGQPVPVYYNLTVNFRIE